MCLLPRKRIVSPSAIVAQRSELVCIARSPSPSRTINNHCSDDPLGVNETLPPDVNPISTELVSGMYVFWATMPDLIGISLQPTQNKIMEINPYPAASLFTFDFIIVLWCCEPRPRYGGTHVWRSPKARSENRKHPGWKVSGISPTGPFRCLATMRVDWPSSSFRSSSSSA